MVYSIYVQKKNIYFFSIKACLEKEKIQSLILEVISRDFVYILMMNLTFWC